MVNKGRIYYYHHPDLGNFHYGPQHPMKPARLGFLSLNSTFEYGPDKYGVYYRILTAATHSLVVNYDLHRYMTCLQSPRATQHDITRFHSQEYKKLFYTKCYN